MLKEYIITNNIIEVYTYDNYCCGKGHDKGTSGRDFESLTNDETKKSNYNKTLSRRNNFIRRYACANFDKNNSKFLTLTFKENLKDVKKANKEFKLFIKRLKQYINYNFDKNFKLKYLAVIEFQERGAIHYHMLCNIPYIDLHIIQNDIWKNGICFINKITHVDNLGAYIVKYITKDVNDFRLMGEKGYLRSNNLIKPKKIVNHNLKSFYNWERKFYDNILKDLKPVYEDEFYNDILGNCNYKQYNLDRK